MSLTAWVDVAIGLVLVYLGASLFVTIINEYIGQIANLRARSLWKSLERLIKEPELRKALTGNPALERLLGDKPTWIGDLANGFRSKGRLPSYVDPAVLARSLVSYLAAGSKDLDGVLKNVEQLPDVLKLPLRTMVQGAEGKIERLVSSVSDWTDRSLTMLGEAYKRNLQFISLLVGFVVACGLNIDTIALVQHLYKDKDAREATVALATQIAEGTDQKAFDTCFAMPAAQRKAEAACASVAGLIDAVQMRNTSLGKLPIGWPEVQGSFLAWVKAQDLGAKQLLGWLLTALALSLGAPFWFDLLNKFVNIRHGMRKPEAPQAAIQKT